MIARLQQHRYLSYLIHLLFWALLLLLPVFMEGGRPRFRDDTMKYRMLVNNLSLMILFYWNAGILYYQVYLRKGLLYYFVSVIFSVIILSYAGSVLTSSIIGPEKVRAHWPEHRFLPEKGMTEPLPRPRPVFFHYPFYLAVLAASFSYSAIREHNRKEKLQRERETELLKNELILLRSQISPHFLFNILNSLVSLARKKSDLLEPSLIHLSALMRYSLYDDSNGRIPLKRELGYLDTYIQLQLLRFGDELSLDMTMPAASEGDEIEPMLLIPFVENAFKHGVGADDAAHIRIDLSLSDGKLRFVVENKIAITGRKDESSGIGLKNVKRRLELLYPQKHDLSITKEEDLFRVELKLILIS